MSLWLLLVVGVAVSIALLAVGVHMVRPSWGERSTRADVGVAVITATVISLAVFVLQILDENRLQREDATRADAAANQALRIQLGLSANLESMDLHGQDLRGINLPERNLAHANFIGADLSGANFSGANLQYVRFDNADLEGAHLGGADLRYATLDNALLRGRPETQLSFADLRYASLVGTQLQNASLENAKLAYINAPGADFTGAVIGGSSGVVYYDRHTVFPNGRTRPCSMSECPLGTKQWMAERG